MSKWIRFSAVFMIVAFVCILCLTADQLFRETWVFVLPQGTYKTQKMSGIGIDYLFYQVDDYMSYWNKSLQTLKKLNFDTVRLSFSFADISGRKEHSVLDYDRLDNVLQFLSANEMKAVLDLHNWQNMRGYFGSKAWEDNWLSVARRYDNDDRILAFELFNEPFEDTWCDAVGSLSDVNVAYASLTDKIRVLDPTREVIWFFTYQIDSKLPSQSTFRDNVYYSLHPWFFDAKTMQDGESILLMVNDCIIAAKSLGLKLWVGEFGVDISVENFDVQEYYGTQMIDLCLKNEIGFCVWQYFHYKTVNNANEMLYYSDYRIG